MTASGSAQLSYWAASTRNTSATARTNTHMAVLPVWSWRKASSVHSVRIDCGRMSGSWAVCSRAAIAWPELVPGPASAWTAADGYMLYRVIITGPLTNRTVAKSASGTI
jgi:hypothetical protein